MFSLLGFIAKITKPLTLIVLALISGIAIGWFVSARQCSNKAEITRLSQQVDILRSQLARQKKIDSQVNAAEHDARSKVFNFNKEIDQIIKSSYVNTTAKSCTIDSDFFDNLRSSGSNFSLHK